MTPPDKESPEMDRSGEEDMKPRLVTTPDDQTWSRPQRPQAGRPPRWPWVAFWTVLAALAGGGWFAFAPEGDDAADGSGSTSANVVRGPDPIDFPDEGFVILHASWGDVDDAPPPVPPPPKNPTEWQERERAFQEMARERWKGTEIFVRRNPR